MPPRSYISWSLKRLVNGTCDRALNRFDVFIVIEGKRGLGKSTLGFTLLKKNSREMRSRGHKSYKFMPKKDILYTRDEVLRFFHKWNKQGMADEMINVSFNRDFYAEGQKDLIKMINMNRDHNNIFIACVPQFKVLDSQIKNLCSMKITVVRRGLAILHFPNKTVYSRDIWDEAYNEKIEREWLKGGVSKPRYQRLTTFAGYLRFPKLSDKDEELYQKIKDEKRNIIAREKNLEEEENKPLEPYEKIFKELTNDGIANNKIFDGMCFAFDLNPDSTRRKIANDLKKKKLPHAVASYYTENKFNKPFGKLLE